MNHLQKLISDLYLTKDKQRGLDKTLIWLVSEIGEVSDIIAKNKEVEKGTEVHGELKLEIADSLAWLLSLANLLEIDIEEAFFEKYPNKCPRCAENPCICKENK